MVVGLVITVHIHAIALADVSDQQIVAAQIKTLMMVVLQLFPEIHVIILADTELALGQPQQAVQLVQNPESVDREEAGKVTIFQF